MRIDMGVMQMELDGHPAAERPEGEESWLDYYEHRRREYEESKVDDYFTLSEEDCRKLRREGVQYYYRYLSLMKIEDYPRVVRDTDRNLRLFAFVKKHAAREMDRWALDQYRLHVIMMNTRAEGVPCPQGRSVRGIVPGRWNCSTRHRKIVVFYNEYSIAARTREFHGTLSSQAALKQEFLRMSRRRSKRNLTRAIRDERFEDAASIRDKLKGGSGEIV